LTTALNGEELGKKIAEALPGSIVAGEKLCIMLDSKQLYQSAEYLKNTAGLDFDYLTVVTAVDYIDYFELVYRLVSLKHNHSIILKTRLYTREDPTVPSVTPLWRAAYYQEREIFDLFGIKFEGHPDLRRLLLWEGFKGHPLRRDYL
jgi:NADH-quinone oxidoreductase subunit C